MPAINFPSSPSLNQTYTFNETTWQWNGTGWVVVGTSSAGGLTNGAELFFFSQL